MEIEKSGHYLDLALLEDYLDRLGKNIVEQMFSLYCQQVEIYLNDIESAQLNDSKSAWQEHCHKMKGASASMGMVKLYEQIKFIEKTDAPKEEKSILLAELQLSNRQALLVFKNWLASK